MLALYFCDLRIFYDFTFRRITYIARNVKCILFNLKQSKGCNSNALQMTHKPRTFFMAFGIY